MSLGGRLDWSGGDPTVVRHSTVYSGKPDQRRVQLCLRAGNGRHREPLDLHVPVADVETLIAELRRAQAWAVTGEES